MPVQTRRRGRSQSASTPVAAKKVKTSASQSPSRHVQAASPKKQHAEPLDTKHLPTAAPKHGSPSPKKDHLNAAASGVHKHQFDIVLKQIGPQVKSHLTPTSARSASRIQKKQDPQKAKYRQNIADEIRRLNAIDPSVFSTPKGVSQLVQTESKRRSEQALATGSKLIKLISDLGESGVKSVLHQPRGRSIYKRPLDTSDSTLINKRVRSVSPSRPAPAAHLNVEEPFRALQLLTVKELKDLVSPTTVYRPSFIKQKLEQRSMKKVLQSQVMKAATLKEIRRLGEKGLHQVLKHRTTAAAGKRRL